MIAVFAHCGEVRIAFTIESARRSGASTWGSCEVGCGST